MERNEPIPLLGLALRGGRLAVGDEAVRDAARSGRARLILVAADASERTRRDAARCADEGHCLLLDLPCTREELGRGLGRGSAAVVSLTDAGLAAAVGRRLAERDSAAYGEAAARLELKQKRAKERRAVRQSASRPHREKPSGRREQPDRKRERLTGNGERPSGKRENSSGKRERPSVGPCTGGGAKGRARTDAGKPGRPPDNRRADGVGMGKDRPPEKRTIHRNQSAVTRRGGAAVTHKGSSSRKAKAAGRRKPPNAVFHTRGSPADRET